MTIDEALDVTRIYSVADQLPPDTPLVKNRPFRLPHHTISHAGLSHAGEKPAGNGCERAATARYALHTSLPCS